MTLPKPKFVWDDADIVIVKSERKHTAWESVDAATDFLKQAEATLKEEPKRNIRGKPIPEGESLKGTKVTQRTVDRELELWQKHPLLRHYLPEDKVRV